MKHLLWALFLLLGCGPMEEPLTEAEFSPTENSDDYASFVEKRLGLCEQQKSRCEQGCFKEYGQFWGTLSPLYNACMDECRVMYEDCSHRPNRVRATQGYAGRATYSWDQPSSEGINGYYGYCGPTAVSNLVMNVCGLNVSPRAVSDMCFSWTPGTTPGNMVRALNELGECGQWALCESASNSADPLSRLETQLPVAALLDWEGALVLHWITVVEISRSGGHCDVIFNHWGGQARMDCNEFIERWSLSYGA